MEKQTGKATQKVPSALLRTLLCGDQQLDDGLTLRDKRKGNCSQISLLSALVGTKN